MAVRNPGLDGIFGIKTLQTIVLIAARLGIPQRTDVIESPKIGGNGRQGSRGEILDDGTALLEAL